MSRDPFATPDPAVQPYHDDPSHLNVGSAPFTVSDAMSHLQAIFTYTRFNLSHAPFIPPPSLSIQLDVHSVNVVQRPTLV